MSNRDRIAVARALHGDRSALADGAVAIAPILLGIVPFGLIAGLAAVEIGLRPLDASAFSLLVFAGAAQLAAIDLLGSGASLGVVVVTAMVINLRMAMYSASLAPYLAGEPRRRRLFAAYFLTDQAYAVSVGRFVRDPQYHDRLRFYLGAAISMWLTWQLATITGALVGRAVPDSVPLGFAVPLAFLSLLVPSVTDRPTLAAAVVAGSGAVMAAPLPANLGMPLATAAGIAVGWTLARRSR